MYFVFVVVNLDVYNNIVENVRENATKDIECENFIPLWDCFGLTKEWKLLLEWGSENFTNPHVLT